MKEKRISFEYYYIGADGNRYLEIVKANRFEIMRNGILLFYDHGYSTVYPSLSVADGYWANVKLVIVEKEE